jgi:6-pyruvoyltetrahydropterin/6-carboxytetrahydropterin synthase
MRVELIKQFTFEAAHTTPWREDPARLHGHSFTVDLVVAGECDARLGWLMDYADITKHFDGLYDQLDHKTLNEVAGLADPTCGSVRAWILERLRPRLPGTLKDVWVSVRGECTFAPKLLHADPAQSLPERVRFGFEAAHALRRLPATHKCHTMHGHSFAVEVAARHADSLAPSLLEVYERLDHRCLNDVTGLDNATSEEMARWIWNALAANVGGLQMVSIAETCTSRCIYYGP